MKKIVLIVMGVFMFCGLATAQKYNKKMDMSPEERAEKMTSRMAKDLSLNDKQIKQVEAINLEFSRQMTMNDTRKPMRKMIASGDSCKGMVMMKERRDMRRMRGNMREAMQLRDAKLKAVLTPEQYAKYMKNMGKRIEKNMKSVPNVQ